MKAIIIAAGKGTRMQGFAGGLPKCMLKFGAKTILERQIGVLNACGITDISVVKGYNKKKIVYPGLKYFINENYKNNNILTSLFYAEAEMDDDIVISYSDIIYEKRVAERLLESRDDITIVVDTEWKRYYKDRYNHTEVEAEKVIFDTENRVREIGKVLVGGTAGGEFIGLLKLSKAGADIFKSYFHRAKRLFWNKSFMRAAAFEKAYLTDMLQYLIDNGVEVRCVTIERGWCEIDTVEDYKKAGRELQLS